MTYIRIDDRFPTHRKAMAAGPLGRDLYVSGLCYCSLHLTNGVIPHSAIHTLSTGLTQPRKVAQRLVEVGLWEVNEDGGWRVHDYHAWNKTASEINELKRLKAEAGQRGGRKSGEARRKHTASSSEEAESKQSGSNAANPASTASASRIPPSPLLHSASAPAASRPRDAEAPHVSEFTWPSQDAKAASLLLGGTRWLPGRWPYDAFHHDCPDLTWRGKCVRQDYAATHPHQHPATMAGSPMQCPQHKPPERIDP